MLLVVNAGSSSLKLLWLESGEKILVAKWDKASSMITLSGVVCESISTGQMGPVDSFQLLIECAQDRLERRGFNLPTKVGYRVVQGGELFDATTEIVDGVLERLATIDHLAPNHNPITRKIVEKGLELMPYARQFLCFDTMFHQTMPQIAKMYGIDLKYYDMGIHKFGFHGISHEYVARKAADMIHKPFSEFSGIVCHLGNGSSITAIENGKSVDTTMGLTPVDGLVMGERSGSIDPSVVSCVSEIEGISLTETVELLSTKSGFKAISGFSSDYRLLKEQSESDPKAKLALDLFKYQIVKYIGSYMAILSHVDLIAFTGGIGENDRELVKEIVQTPGLKNLGLGLGFAGNKIPVVQISTNEEMAIAALIGEE